MRLLTSTAAAAAVALAVLAANCLTATPSHAANQLGATYTSGGIRSRYHLFDAGLNTTKPVGLLMYADGSGGYGIDNPNGTYLLDADGTDGLVAVARKHNLVLVVPAAPAPDCAGADNCWHDSTALAKAKWSSDLMSHIKGKYRIDTRRVVIGGYSSGAQWTRWFLPTHGEAQSVDLAVAIAYGGAPAVTPRFTDAYKKSAVLSWDTGTADSAHTTASYGARGGYNWYKSNGFTKVDATWPAGVGHSRSGQFDAIMDREITQHLTPATSG